MPAPDPRRKVPRTDALLADPRLADAVGRLGRGAVKATVIAVQQRIRAGTLHPEHVVAEVLARLPPLATTMRPVLNATGVVLHTNLGRAALSAAAVSAVAAAAGYVDVEFDLADGARAPRGRGALAALAEAVPDAGAVLVVNNGAAALLLAASTLGAGREVIVSRGELVEIGDGFRLPELIESTGARIREVGTTNRTSLADYAAAIGPVTGAVIKVHPSNFVISGFTSAVDVANLATLGPPVIVDVGSGLFHPADVPGEPDVSSALRAGAAVVTCSGDKLLGGPQAGLVFGRLAEVTAMRRSPLARALRVDKLTLAALEATLRGPVTPTADFLNADPRVLRARCERMAVAVGAEVVPSAGAVGGGGAPGLQLPGWAVALPEECAAALRCGVPPVVGRIAAGRCLLDLRCVPPAADGALIAAIRAVFGG